MKLLRFKWILGLLITILLTSCAAGSKEEGFYGESDDPGAPMEVTEDSLSRKAESSDMSGNLETTPSPVTGEGGGTSTDSDSVRETRKRIYNGSAGIVVEDTEETRLDLETLTLDAGGYVESSYSDYLELRVPAEIFNDFFKMVLSMGQVEFSRVETLDVTEAYADIQRQLATAEETRSRLYYLLEKSTDPKERALILREIGRLTEEIESLKQQTAIMESRISFSRITVQLIPRIQSDSSQVNIPFPWIAYLDPLYPAGDKLRARVSLDPGDDFAVFSKESVYLAENSGGTQILISTISNSPRGDNRFWQRALVYHLSPYYAESKELNLNFGDSELLGVEFLSKDRKPYRYFIAAVADGRKLHIVEIFSSDAEQGFKRLYKSFAEGELK